MNAPFKQTDRAGRLTTALGPDVLVLTRFDGSDRMNDLFEYRVEALAPGPDVDFDTLIGTHATVTLKTLHGPRHFDGIVTRARWVGVGENGHRYEMVLRPWLYLASRRRNQRIFHEKTVVQILQELLEPYASLGDPALEMRLTGDYKPLEYTVQYRESDMDFACRMMERSGINYYFAHRQGSHTMVLTDSDQGHDSIAGTDRPFYRVDREHTGDEEHFWEMAPERNLTTGAVRVIDYNFKTPAAAMEADRIGDAAYAFGQLESYEYPGDYLDQDGGKAAARLRVAQERGKDRRNRAVGNVAGLSAGMIVGLTGDDVPGVADQQLCLTANHSFMAESYGSGGDAGDDFAYTGQYTLMPVSAPLAPPNKTPRPIVQGPQTAVVVGSGEIDCDEFGRILVQFHWDLAGARSMRCRVAQNWAGNGLGGVVIPRIGMEVVVDFIDGNPDKPIVTGCVVNGSNGNIYGLPASKTKSGFKTKTHEGSGFNELSFEDANGGEKIFMHAQKDLERVVKDNESTLVEGGNRSIAVQTGDETKDIASGNLTETVALTRATTANVIVEMAKAGRGGPGVIAYSADDDIAMTAVKNVMVNSDRDMKHTATNIMELKSDNELQQKGENLVEIKSPTKIVLKVGSGSITMTTDGIQLKFGSTTVTLNEGTLEQVAGEIHLNKES